jgi:hypothetical protein
VAELADAHDSKSCGEIRVGSTPTTGITKPSNTKTSTIMLRSFLFAFNTIKITQNRVPRIVCRVGGFIVSRRKNLTAEELQIIKKTISDQEAFESFYTNCYLKNLRPATIGYYKNEFHAANLILPKELVECTQKDIEELILQSKKIMKTTTINTRLRALRAFYNYLHKSRLIEKNPMKNIKLLRDRQKNIETKIREWLSLVPFHSQITSCTEDRPLFDFKGN